MGKRCWDGWTRKAKALFVKHSSGRTGIYLIYMLIQFYLYVTDRGGRPEALRLCQKSGEHCLTSGRARWGLRDFSKLEMLLYTECLPSMSDSQGSAPSTVKYTDHRPVGR